MEGSLAEVCWHLNNKYPALKLDAGIAGDTSNGACDSELARIGAALLTGCISGGNSTEYLEVIVGLHESHMEALQAIIKEIDPSVGGGSSEAGGEEENDDNAEAQSDSESISSDEDADASSEEDDIELRPRVRRSGRLGAKACAAAASTRSASSRALRRAPAESDTDSDSDGDDGVRHKELLHEVEQLRKAITQQQERAKQAEDALQETTSKLETAQQSLNREDREASAQLEQASMASAKLSASEDQLALVKRQLREALSEAAE